MQEGTCLSHLGYGGNSMIICPRGHIVKTNRFSGRVSLLTFLSPTPNSYRR